MPIGDQIFIGCVIAAFGIFSVELAYANWRSGGKKDAR